MATTIYVNFPDISGDGDTYTAFMRNESATLLNSGGDVIVEGTTTLWSFSVDETISTSEYYLVRIYAGSSETGSQLVYDGLLYPGQTIVDRSGSVPQTGDSYPFGSRIVIRGTVDAGVSTTTSLTPSVFNVEVSTPDQLKGKILTFDITTTTQGLRGQSTDITANTSATLPLLTFTLLTATPVSGDTFSIQ